MSGEMSEIWRSEAVAYGFMIVNLASTAMVLVWAWRRGMFKNLDETMRTSLQLPDSDHSNQTKESHS
jgi:hypothetical protein